MSSLRLFKTLGLLSLGQQQRINFARVLLRPSACAEKFSKFDVAVETENDVLYIYIYLHNCIKLYILYIIDLIKADVFII